MHKFLVSHEFNALAVRDLKELERTKNLSQAAFFYPRVDPLVQGYNALLPQFEHEQACLEGEDLGAVFEGGELDGMDEGDDEEASVSLSAASADAEPAQTAGNKRKSGQKHDKRRVKRAKDRTTQAGPSAATLSHVLSPGTAVKVELDVAEFDAAKSTQTGDPGTLKKLRSLIDWEQLYDIAELLADGFEHIKWDRFTLAPIIDWLGYIVAVLADRSATGELMKAHNEMNRQARDHGLVMKTWVGCAAGQSPEVRSEGLGVTFLSLRGIRPSTRWRLKSMQKQPMKEPNLNEITETETEGYLSFSRA
ncbi:hypothetical protein BT96DRAFT_1040728 [Gymnopus androsaceus JB14]|uniref:Uncharacterized protein n=1 Tax=Gymnopus androsaceus JB14 TaxID=1447944 RepID=A0A6A4GC28_9AGAR|nr:hypothetical protein BT96DRAFT_1040728 [Gymnopus androsaceus JB14]